jgi:hypothetical protein
MPLPADAIERDTVIAYQLLEQKNGWWRVAYTAVPEEGKGIIEADGSAFHIAPSLIALIPWPLDHFLVVRWNMSGPLDYAVQRDDSEEVLERLPFILNRKNAYQEMPESRYGDLGRLRWVMDRAITFGDWRKF